MKDSLSIDTGDGLKFDWKGGPVLLGDLGDPIATTRYELCVYDDSGIETALGVAPGSPAGNSRLGHRAEGLQYKEALGTQAGRQADHAEGEQPEQGQAQGRGEGRVAARRHPAVQANVTAQLHSGDGKCWEAQFGPAETRRTDIGQFSGRTPAP